MESSELVAFFNDCALYPAPEAVEEAWDAVRKVLDGNVQAVQTQC